MSTAKLIANMTDQAKNSKNSGESSLSSLLNQRKYMRQSITRISNTVNSNLDGLTELKKSGYRDKLKSLKNEISVVSRQIYGYCDDGVTEEQLAEEEEYEDKITEALESLQENPVVAPPSGSNQTSSPPLLPNRLSLPVICLPSYSHEKHESFEKFFYSFESIINKHSLSQYEKFVYLKGQLGKAPKVLVDSLDVGDQSYIKAKQLLTEAFASPLSQKYDAIKRLSQIKLSINADPYSYVGDMMSVISSFKNLKIEIEEVMQFFIWEGMNDRFQSQLISITNKSKPSLDDISAHIFEASERYIKINERFKERQKQKNSYNSNVSSYAASVDSLENNNSSLETNNMAINVNTGKFKYPCHLCVSDRKKNVSHHMRECRIYASPQSKVDKLEGLKFCSLCSFKNHSTGECKFRFSSKCSHCNGDHMTYLCVGSGETLNSNDAMNTNARVSWVQTLQVSSNNDEILLPTITVCVQNCKGREIVRALKDSGSQRNFVSEHISKLLHLKVLQENIELLIHGFNSTKRVFTKVVTVPLKLGECIKDVSAVVIPDIHLALNIPNLDLVVNNFVSKHYVLADSKLEGLRSRIDDFSLVLGADADSLLETKTVLFGDVNNKSAYIDSCIGVMLSGNVDTMIKNLKFLPDLKGNIISDPIDPFIVCDDKFKFHGCEYDLQDEVIFNNVAVDVLNENGYLLQSKLNKATDDILEDNANLFLNYDNNFYNETDTEVNNKIVNYVLDNCDRTSDGRIILPLPWNPENKNLLGTNFNLSRNILCSNLKKLKKSNVNLSMYDRVFREQEDLEIIERIDNIDSFMSENPDCSFLPHMGIFKMNRETTKCRVVYLSNLCEKSSEKPNAISHNQALLPGPSLNHKLSTTIIFSRFNKYLLTFDICKAFLGIKLRETDCNKLCFLWYRDVLNGDFSLIAYRSLRLSFGLRPSPTLLMLALYKILILDAENDDAELREIKKSTYCSMYMDNGGFSCNDESTLIRAYKCIPEIFKEYQFNLQQYMTNNLKLQGVIDSDNECMTEKTVNFLGMQWHRDTDKLSPYPIKFNVEANTKRMILSSLNSVYDLFNMYLPMINRAKLYFQRLQNDKSINWDTELPQQYLKEWTCIARQANLIPLVYIDRFVGRREEEYDLIAFSDSSGAIYGTVVYIRSINENKVSYLTSKSKLLNKQLVKKTIPSLECQGIAFAAEVVTELFVELTGDSNVCPISIRNITVYTDSMVCIYWLQSYFSNYDKMQKRSVFTLNRLKAIDEFCKIHPIKFCYVEGRDNPADCVTRSLSYKTLCKTNFYNGPDFLSDNNINSDIEVIVPNPLSMSSDFEKSVTFLSSVSEVPEHIVNPERFSSFHKLANVHATVLKFVKILMHDNVPGSLVGESDQYASICNKIISTDQKINFPDIFEYFRVKPRGINRIPNLILQLNLFVDENSLIRVKGKFSQIKCPILLNSKSLITSLIVRDTHHNMSHSGLYSLLRQIRKRFWILRGVSTVKKILSKCIVCKKVNARPIKLTQNSYRSFRENPPQIPFSYVYLDFMGPFFVRYGGEKKKVWIMLVTCMWSRAVNMCIAFSMDVNEFLRCVQSHIYSYGLFQLCISDLGSQIVAGSKIICNFLDEPDTHDFFVKHGIQNPSFQQFSKGNSSLGSMVEICVKLSKELLHKSIGKNVLEYPEFDLVVSKTVHLINRRPVAFKESLCSNASQDDPVDPITPERLLRGYDLTSLNVIPQMQPDNLDVSFSCENIVQNYVKLKRVNEKLRDLYHSEFLCNILYQAIDRKDRYKPVKNCVLSVGDIVLLVENNTKQSNYPMGIVKSVDMNSIGEVTAAVIHKGSTGEKVYRHASSLILLIPSEVIDGENHERSVVMKEIEKNNPTENKGRKLPTRKAALKSRDSVRALIADDLI